LIFFTLNISQLHNEKAYVFKVLWRPKISMKCKSGIGRNISVFLSVRPSVRLLQWHIVAACMSRSGWTDGKIFDDL